MTKTYTRADDEKLLRALALRDRGHSTASIARAVGIPRNVLNGLLSRVDAAASAGACVVCGSQLGASNTTGVCRAHNHAAGHCECAQCRRAA